jgi:type I restriction enzyme R subunit
LEDILRKQLKEINSIRVSSAKTSVFSDANIEAGIQALKSPPMQEGYISASESVYNLLTLGKSLEQSIDGDKKSFTLQYIDWQYPQIQSRTLGSLYLRYAKALGKLYT